MKKLTSVIILFLCLLFQSSVYAQDRGALSNLYASWVSVAPVVDQTYTFPNNSRDLCISNGSAIDIFVNLTGGEIGNDLVEGGTSHVIQLDGPEQLCLYDYITGGITLRSTGVAASPVSFTVTY